MTINFIFQQYFSRSHLMFPDFSFIILAKLKIKKDKQKQNSSALFAWMSFSNQSAFC